MAPRRRPRQRNTRMDAAIDAMIPLGFSEALVRQNVKKLLTVYGGDECWPFIEENAYSQLIEALIEASAETAEDIDEEEGEGSRLQDNIQEQEASAAITSNDIADSEQIGPDVVHAISESVRPEAMENVARPQSYSPPARHMDCDPPVDVNGHSWKDIRLDQSSDEKEAAVAVIPGPISSIPPSSTEAICIQPANNHVIRRPCYGWLDCDEGELDFIYLTPAARQTPPSDNSDGKTSKRIRRTSRWDLKPEDS